MSNAARIDAARSGAMAAQAERPAKIRLEIAKLQETSPQTDFTRREIESLKNEIAMLNAAGYN
ncbi:hypothetical protein GO003_002790 [Methylicorpusculum oleiharenae]|uniref:hypothetical protein n=1 Tax=Methylicorpusculum oleiharenae TaxID=1338687 RepID=UPI0013571516|nr:hypothetical protein [Methylicorpusculum oleiharenae]MCD2449315.1 hypothetical protein [Methylicorpusculum oleiharenae]